MNGYFAIRQKLQACRREPAPGRIQVLTGPRQVGKTTLLPEIADQFGAQARYLAADSPEAALPDWWLTRWQAAVRLARQRPAVLLVDEVQGMPDWSRGLKVGYDEIARERLPLQMVVSGSSSLQVSGGARESMARRFERLNLRQWTARDLVEAFAFPPEIAALTVVRYGAFPGGVSLLASPVWRNVTAVTRNTARWSSATPPCARRRTRPGLPSSPGKRTCSMAWRGCNEPGDVCRPTNARRGGGRVARSLVGNGRRRYAMLAISSSGISTLE